MKKNIFIITVVVFLTAFIVGSGVFVWQKKAGEKNQNEAVENTKQEMQAQINDLQDVLNQSIDLDLLKPLKMSWFKEKDKLMSLDGRIVYDTSLREISSIEEENAKYEALFEQAGFVKNEMNTNLEGKQYVLDPRIGFEKGNLQCVISWDQEAEQSIYGTSRYGYRILCAEHTKEDDENFDIFYSLVNTNNNESAKVFVYKKNDNFAVGGINFYRTGARWYASKQNGEWFLDLITQDYPPCSVVKDYPEDFYAEYYGGCWDGEGISKINANIENQIINIIDWQTYKNEDYGFEVKYPKDWEISKLPDPKVGFLLKSENYSEKVYLRKTKNEGNLSIVELIDTFNDTSRFWPQEFPYESTTINGKDAVVFDYIKDGEQERKEVFIKTNNYVFTLAYLYEEKNESVEKIFDQIVKEIQFVGELK